MHVLCAAALVTSIGSVAFVSANYRPALFKWALNSFWLSRSIGGVPHQKTRDTRRTPFQILLIHWPFDMKCQIREQKLMMTWVHRVLGALFKCSGRFRVRLRGPKKWHVWPATSSCCPSNWPEIISVAIETDYTPPGPTRGLPRGQSANRWTE